MANRLVIEKATRTQGGTSEETLEFGKGVNVIVGAPNTGKTAWLRMINFVLSSDDKAEDAMGNALATKYDSVALVVRMDDAKYLVERKWKEAGARTKVYVDEQVMSSDEFCQFVMGKLKIPILHYPQGDPFGRRTWPELSWRSLFRHLYRRQRLWGDFADQQPESEQLACILQFVGLAQHLYSEEYESLVLKQKSIIELTARKDQFIDMLREVSKDLLDESTPTLEMTPESLSTAVQQVENDMAEASTRRSKVLQTLAIDASARLEIEPVIYEKASAELAQVKSHLAEHLRRLHDIEVRLAEIRQYQETLRNELARLKRAQSAGSLLSELRVTHCPACDQEIHRRDYDSSTCYVCGQETQRTIGVEGEKRLSFEVEQLSGELKEADQLIAALTADRGMTEVERLRAQESSKRLEDMLRPIQIAAAQIFPAEVSFLDMHVGQLQERARQLSRIQAALIKREKINEQIVAIQAEIGFLESLVATHARNLNFGQASDALEDGMNNYLAAIKGANPRSWTLDSPVRFHLRERGFGVTVGNEDWKSKLGGTLTLYFVIAYQYALMQLRTRSASNFPGLLLLDFPAQLEDGTSIADKENFVLEPFLKLCNETLNGEAQVIAMGSAFKDLPVSKRIELTRVWE
jgi:hypothetical protein